VSRLTKNIQQKGKKIMDLKTVDELLTTTRSVRKRLDLARPVEPEIIEECLELALQAPTGSNSQDWHFMVISDAKKRAKIAEYYKSSWDKYSQARVEPTRGQASNPSQMRRVVSSAQYLADNLAKIPILIIPCIKGDLKTTPLWMQASYYGSVIPATWSLMLALRSRGLGSSYTTLHLRYDKEISELLGIPESMTQVALLPIAYFTGDTFKAAKRLSAKELTSWDTWGNKKE
jgi:nitroreductase